MVCLVLDIRVTVQMGNRLFSSVITTKSVVTGFQDTLCAAGLSFERIITVELYLHFSLRNFFFFRSSITLVGLGLLIVEVSRSQLDALHSVGLLWTSDRPDAETSAYKIQQ